MVARGTRLATEGIRINDEVKVKDMDEQIGIGTVQGFSQEHGGLPIVRFYLSTLKPQGEKYLQNKKCLTSSGKGSRLYVIPIKELIVRRNGSKRKTSQGTE